MTSSGTPGGERRHEPVFPGFKEMSERRKALAGTLAARRTEIGLSQTQVAARMGTSQSAVARLESGDADVRLSTLERYAAALGERLDWGFERPVAKATIADRNPRKNPGGSPSGDPKVSTRRERSTRSDPRGHQ
jgi:transcriptional regulator with XRE-family HTH domain